MTDKIVIQSFESNEVSISDFLGMVIDNGKDFSIGYSDDSEYFVNLHRIHKQIKITGGSSSGSEFIDIMEVK